MHPLAALRVFWIDGGTDVRFLERVFQKLLINFTWWLNRQDPDGNNLFGGGFLGLDNISPLDRSHLPPGIRIEQADGTAWMAYYSLAMLVLAARLAEHDDVYDDMVVKFLEQFVMIVDAVDHSGLYDPVDGFFYDRLVDGDKVTPIRVQTLVGVFPILPAGQLALRHGERTRRMRKRVASRFEAEERTGERLAARLQTIGDESRLLVSIVSPDGLPDDARRLLRRGRVPVAPRPALDLQAPHRALRRPRGAGRASSTSRPRAAPTCTAATPTGGGRCGRR